MCIRDSHETALALRPVILPQPEVLSSCQSDPLRTGSGHFYEFFFYAELLCFYAASIVSTPTHSTPTVPGRRQAMSRTSRTSRMAGGRSLGSPRAARTGGADAKLADLERRLAASEKAKDALVKENTKLDKARRKAEVDRIAAQKANLTAQRKLVTAQPPQSPAAAAGNSAATAVTDLSADDDDELVTDDAAAGLFQVTGSDGAGDSQ